MNREKLGIYKAIIVGGGASGLALSICLSDKFPLGKVAIFEKNIFGSMHSSIGTIDEVYWT